MRELVWIKLANTCTEITLKELNEKKVGKIE